MTSASRPLCILIVDDRERDAVYIAEQLYEYEVTTAIGVNEAFRLLTEAQFGVVVMRWVMEGMSGIDFCKAIRGMLNIAQPHLILATNVNPEWQEGARLHFASLGLTDITICDKDKVAATIRDAFERQTLG